MTTQPERIEEVKTWFEANYLDGDAVQEGQMLASSECLDALITQQQSHHQELQKAREEERALIKATIETLLLQVQPLPEDADRFMGEHEQTVVQTGYMVKEWAMQAFEEPDHSELDQPTELFNTIKKDWDKQAEDLMNGDPTNITSDK